MSFSHDQNYKASSPVVKTSSLGTLLGSLPTIFFPFFLHFWPDFDGLALKSMVFHSMFSLWSKMAHQNTKTLVFLV